MKATVLHIIESLAIGGAEVLLTESLKDISDKYRHVVVYMRPPATLLSKVKADKIFCLGFKGKSNILFCVLRLRRIILEEQISLIHAHHYWPTIVSRLAKPKRIPLLFTIHSPLGVDAFEANRLSLHLERMTYRKEHHAIFISEAVKDDYIAYMKSMKGQFKIINNFAADNFFKPENSKTTFTLGMLRLVAVGTLKSPKNYFFLLNVMELIKDYTVHLDIIGDGPLRSELENSIKENNLTKVKLLGSELDIDKLLKEYDAFILSSTHEGMSLAVIEAMAVGLPCILSDIKANKNVADTCALYFDIAFPHSCAEQIFKILEEGLAQKLSAAGKIRALNFQKQNYLVQLEELYKQYLP